MRIAVVDDRADERAEIVSLIEEYRKRQMSSTYTAPTQSIKLFPVTH